MKVTMFMAMAQAPTVPFQWLPHVSHSLSHCHCPDFPSAEWPQQHFSSLKCAAQMGSTSQTKATAVLFTREKDQWAPMKGQETDVLTVTCW